MSQDHPDQTAETTIQPEGENNPSALDGISRIRTTLDELEVQIAQYRNLLAEEEEAAKARQEAEAPVVEVVDETQLGNIAAEIAAEAAALYDPPLEREVVATQQALVEVAPLVVEVEKQGEAVVAADDLLAEADEEEAIEERELLAEPEVDLPELFAELQLQKEMGLHRTASVSIFVDGEELLSYLSSETGFRSVTPELHNLCSGRSHPGRRWRQRRFGGCWTRESLEINAPVAQYWPEFAQRGKSSVTLRHVLTHTAGLPRDFGRGDVDWGDWGRMLDILASMPLEYEPGEVIHYHSITFGLLVAQIASRATGERFVDLFESEVASPLGFDEHIFRRRFQRPGDA